MANKQNPMTRRERQEWRWRDDGMGYPPSPVRLIVLAEGYAMVRRKGCMPFVIPEKEWVSLPKCEGE